MLIRSWFVLVLIFLCCLLFFSYRLLDVPRGITLDEAGFGYNASLISKTLRDENGRFLPVFVLSLNGRDWRQPLTQYLQVLTFKIFGASLFNLKFTSVFIVSISAVLIFVLSRQLFDKKFAFINLIIFVTTPIIMIHSHLALDNIMPMPFILLWLLGLINFRPKKSIKYLLLSAVSLGLSFYAHKSMRSATTVWTMLTVLFLWFTEIRNKGKLDINNYKIILIFGLAILPFFLAAPILDYKYAGAVFGSQSLNISSPYDFIYFYISTFDISFLFIKGDSIMHHSTGKHGMFLLSTLPFLFYGIYKAIFGRQKFLIFLIVCFFSGPLFFGFIGSVYRASRLIFLVPPFTIIASFGIYELAKIKTKFTGILLAALCLLFIVNYTDFIKYYWFQYPQDTYNIFFHPSGINAYKRLDEISKAKNLTPLIDNSLITIDGDGKTIEDFSRSLYFTNAQSWDASGDIPEKSILLTNKKDIKNLKLIESPVSNYYLYMH